jgi:hypothetical protein
MRLVAKIWMITGMGLCAACAEQDEPQLGTSEDELTRCRVPPTLDARRSLYETNVAVLNGADFSLRRTLGQLALQSGEPGLTANELFKRWWDSQNTAPGFGGPVHCNDEIIGGEATLNGFPHQCPRTEGQQAGAPAAEIAKYVPIGLVNRFDLAPVTGENCGEYRIVYGRNDFSRNFLIFEAKLPNPSPGCGIQGCRAVQELWASLSTIDDPLVRARKLSAFYYRGLTGFAPVVHIDNYRGSDAGYSGASGQIRTNQFITFPWNLRENVTELGMGRNGPTLTIRPVTVKTNPFGELFNGDLPESNDPLAPIAAKLQATILENVDALAVDDINGFSMTIPDEFNAGESQVFGFGPTDYLAQFNADGGSSAFRTRLQRRAQEHGLSADDIINRAMTQSCGGCHQESVGRPLGGSLGNWPSSAGFVHNSEFTEAGPEGDRFQISDALTGTFLPHRLTVMQRFLGGSACRTCTNPVPIDIIKGIAEVPGAPPPADEAAQTIGGSRSVH